MPDMPPRPAPTNWLPMLVLALLVLSLAGGVWLFPRVAAYMARQDCIATGHVNCGPA